MGCCHPHFPYFPAPGDRQALDFDYSHNGKTIRLTTAATEAQDLLQLESEPSGSALPTFHSDKGGIFPKQPVRREKGFQANLFATYGVFDTGDASPSLGEADACQVSRETGDTTSNCRTRERLHPILP